MSNEINEMAVHGVVFMNGKLKSVEVYTEREGPPRIRKVIKEFKEFR